MSGKAEEREEKCSQVLEGLDAVLDVGGVYDPARDRYDHHQKGFEEVFGHGFSTKLSSAGLVYKHFGKEIIAKELKVDEVHQDVHHIYLAVYKSFMELHHYHSPSTIIIYNLFFFSNFIHCLAHPSPHIATFRRCLSPLLRRPPPSAVVGQPSFVRRPADLERLSERQITPSESVQESSPRASTRHLSPTELGRVLFTRRRSDVGITSCYFRSTRRTFLSLFCPSIAAIVATL
ncbi:hypothetical protein LR48_Vigan11g124600 [Vigna angularis]|uniref:Uncharacterized protein n=1 Tax=Phaseolus angularis TaxID=3914 RepID=A0A0L9VTM9_PHAAN|nr:hypothetical protein LR48_Vigan11g124600 [Vigna angularis]